MERYRQLTPEQERERDTLIFGEYDPDAPYWGGIHSYSGLSPETMETLIQKGYALSDESQNDSPSIAECLEFCKAHRGFTMHGYVVSRARDDCRVSVEGVAAKAEDAAKEGDADYVDTLIDFIDAFRWADEFSIGAKGADWYCWYD